MLDSSQFSAIRCIAPCSSTSFGAGVSVLLTDLRGRVRLVGRSVLALAVCAVLSGSAWGQGTDAGLNNAVKSPEFESATISPHAAGEFASSVGGPPGRFEAKNVTAKTLVQMAFNVAADRVSGGPQWAGSQRFDVTANISDALWSDLHKPDNDRDQIVRHMLQSLLAQRFQLAVTHQQKDLLVFALVACKSGAKLRVAGTPKSETVEEKTLLMAMEQDDVPVSALASFLAAHFGRTVLDNTGLSRRYDIQLRVQIPDENSPDAVNRAIFSALENQLGLKLVTRRMVLDTIVIDRIEQPADQ